MISQKTFCFCVGGGCLGIGRHKSKIHIADRVKCRIWSQFSKNRAVRLKLDDWPKYKTYMLRAYCILIGLAIYSNRTVYEIARTIYQQLPSCPRPWNRETHKSKVQSHSSIWENLTTVEDEVHFVMECPLYAEFSHETFCQLFCACWRWSSFCHGMCTKKFCQLFTFCHGMCTKTFCQLFTFLSVNTSKCFLWFELGQYLVGGANQSTHRFIHIIIYMYQQLIHQ